MQHLLQEMSSTCAAHDLQTIGTMLFAAPVSTVFISLVAHTACNLAAAYQAAPPTGVKAPSHNLHTACICMPWLIAAVARRSASTGGC